ncbi:multidrug efflux system, subunit C [uncultured Pleomorphomonas sp.]|uniref:Multidrug efflux system, subunit C n=1 Tax=uncultured Pleomorphomonas sp. TaxID=442121 RepID=A0A212LPR5_9HYPH|nr:efflux RND transporter permease subunit [uncultured Pleomorphomonas sp.]SCM79409.1 multidrug efflux system, subunit C [uncultured Pleomorphomonas sp.]
MNLPALFIRRPVAAILLAIGLSLAGFFAYRLLPVAALPRVDFPTITVSAQLSGASPETMATAVATPLIKQFQTISGIDTISARSSLGSTSITLQFELSRDIDSAAADVQSAIDSARRRLPDNMTSDPSYRKVNPADMPILLLSVTSPTVPLTELDSLAQNVLSPAISTISGVAQAQIFGSQKYAVRVEADPDRLAARGIGLDQLATAIANANNQSPVGSMDNAAQTITLDAPTQLTSADGFRTLIVSAAKAGPVRLGDVADVIDSVENRDQASWYDGTRAITLAVQRQPDANTVEVVDAIKAALPAITAQLPDSVDVSLMNDNSAPIRAAVADVQFTLLLTIGLVVLVIYLFLGKLYTTAIPAIAVPLSILIAFGAMYVLGYSIDNMSLLALTLSVGLVVDDAIVMLENIVHHIEQGEKPMAAAFKGSAEVTSTIISMSLSLIAVFLPILLMGGVVGRLFTEFGMVVSLAITASALVSLTVTPTLAARLPADIGAPPGRYSLAGLFDAGFSRVLAGYSKSVGWTLRHPLPMVLVFLATFAGSAWLFASLPKSFLPQEDIGQLSISTQARQDISYDAMAILQKQAADVVGRDPAVAHVNARVGDSQLNSGGMNVQLKPAAERDALDVVVGRLRQSLGHVVGLQSFVTPSQSLRLGGRSSQSQYQLVVQSLDAGQLGDWAERLRAAMAQDTANFTDVATDLQNNALQARIVIDRDRAEIYGITAATLRNTLGEGFGEQSVADIQSTGDSYSVILEYAPGLAWNNDRLSELRIRSSTTGALVPLTAFATVERQSGPVTLNQTGQLTSITVSFNLPQGVSLGAATSRIDAIKQEIGLPSTVFTAFAGTAQVFAQSTANTPLLILAAILTIYVVLGVLYESFIHPLTILSGLPSAALGALLALKLTGMDLSIIALIGILMLIGIVKKNAIMMVDVALQMMREDGAEARAAIHEAATRRFRPIMMTTFCALLGTLPIAIGHGASAELRQPLGVAVVGGLVVSQLLTLYITPVIFVGCERLRGMVSRRSEPRVAETPAE